MPPMAASGPTRMLDRSRSKCGRGLAPDGGLRADQNFVSILAQMWEGACPRWRPQSRPEFCVDPGSNVGGGLPPMAASGPTQNVGSDRVHIRFCGNGRLGFRFYSGSLLKSAKVSKTLLPHHSAPRLSSVCPHSGLNPWAAATRHSWRGAANPASCRVTHGFKPAFGQRGLTGRLRSKADQERLASHCGYGWALLSCVGTYAPIAECQSVNSWLIHHYRGQAPSHRGSAVYEKGDPKVASFNCALIRTRDQRCPGSGR
ncbi:Threonine synthase [Pseudomonas orientalis]|nr:Threonine synthase [Pseudomonas orientalis]